VRRFTRDELFAPGRHIAQQIPEISNRIGKTADPSTHFSNFPGSSSWAKRGRLKFP
jgi:hypothetical protein